jgi:hypothetical protein
MTQPNIHFSEHVLFAEYIYSVVFHVGAKSTCIASNVHETDSMQIDLFDKNCVFNGCMVSDYTSAVTYLQNNNKNVIEILCVIEYIFAVCVTKAISFNVLFNGPAALQNLFIE